MAIRMYNPKVDEKRVLDVTKKQGDARSPYRRDVARLIHSPCFRRLQGKAQLFPSDEGDFFRNRLTHSLEVAQIASGIALNLNQNKKELSGTDHAIDVDLVHFAALAHDLGHPPFGHDGERALDQLIWPYGGFEGNAQTLRILARLEKRETEEWPQTVIDGKDIRVGLNLTYRSLASVLKYDRKIPTHRESTDDIIKGYYGTEAPIVNKIRSEIAPRCPAGEFKTIECSIMDLADDIAYSTYDLEDAFKAGFISPISMAAKSDEFKRNIADVVNAKMANAYPADIYRREKLSIDDVNGIILSIFDVIFEAPPEIVKRIERKAIATDELSFALSADAYAVSDLLREDGYLRSELTSRLVYIFMNSVDLQWNSRTPCLSQVYLGINEFKLVEVLKRFSYESLIMSNRLKMADRRGREIIQYIFKALSEKGGEILLPDDLQKVYAAKVDKAWRRRVICDFIASMTDRYCVEFYSRLVGITVPSIYKPY